MHAPVKGYNPLMHTHIIGVLLGAAALLLIPLVAMQITDAVNWSAGDFLTAWALLSAAGITYVLIASRMNDTRQKVAIAGAIALILFLAWAQLAVGLFGKERSAVADYKNIAYKIEAVNVQLLNGAAETEAAPGSASKVETKYFGNDLVTDLNSDGRDDIVFLLTQSTGGSGVFYYVVAALNLESGYVGSDGYFLGDRIAPQTINVSPNPRHVNVIVANYADRSPGEPMIDRPSIGKSAYLKLDPEHMMWAIVEPDFEGESR